MARAIGDPISLGRTLNRVGNWHLNVGRAFEARQHHQEALDIFTALNDRRGRAESLNLLGLANYVRRHQTGHGLLRTSDPVFRELDDRVGLIYALAHLCIRARLAEPRDATDIAGWVPSGEAAVRMAREIGWRSGEAMALILTTMCLISVGIGRALEWAQAALAYGRRRAWRLGGDCPFGNRRVLVCWRLPYHCSRLRCPGRRRCVRCCRAPGKPGVGYRHGAKRLHTRGRRCLRRLLISIIGATTQERTCVERPTQLSLARGGDATRALQIVDGLISGAANTTMQDAGRHPALETSRGRLARGRSGSRARTAGGPRPAACAGPAAAVVACAPQAWQALPNAQTFG